MKIDRVILSCTHDEYYEYFDIVSKAWLKMGIKPTLFLITDKKIVKNKNIIQFNIENVGKPFIAQNIRLLAPSLFPNDISIISDIDMMPLSEDYFQKNIKSYDDDNFILYRTKVTSENMYPICYNAAKGTTWSEIFQVGSMEDIQDKLKLWNPDSYEIEGRNWYLDQILLKQNLDRFEHDNSERLVKLNDNETKFERLNRTQMKFLFSKFYDSEKNYSDFHMPKPYVRHKKLIKRVFEANFKES